MKQSLEPLYKLYDLDPGMKAAEKYRHTTTRDEAAVGDASDAYDENALWAEVKSKSHARTSLDSE